jgi:ornithine carbamoyltransferase
LTKEEIEEILKTSELLKLQTLRGQENFLLKGKTLAMIFEKALTWNCISFAVGIRQLGGYALYLSLKDFRLGRWETITDTARTLSRYVNGIKARVFSHQTILDLISNSREPIIDVLSDFTHPCQGLAELSIIQEKKSLLLGLKLAYIVAGNSVAQLLIYGCT